MNTHTKPIQIFRAGTHIATNGESYTLTEQDLATSASAYNPALYEAPLIIGHSQTDKAPSYGGVASLFVQNGAFEANTTDVDPTFADLVNNKRYKSVSASFYTPNNPSNPVPNVWYLRHVAFLGAKPPAIKGLRPPEFCEGDFITIEFSESDSLTTPTQEKSMTMTPEEIAAKQAEIAQKESALAAEKAALKQKETEIEQQNANFAERESALQQQEQTIKRNEITVFIDGLVKQGKILPKDKNNLAEFLEHQNSADVVDFSENEGKVKKTPFDWFKSYLSNLPKQVDFSEFDKNHSHGADGKTLTEKQRADKVKRYMDTQHISFAEADDMVTAELNKQTGS